MIAIIMAKVAMHSGAKGMWPYKFCYIICCFRLNTFTILYDSGDHVPLNKIDVYPWVFDKINMAFSIRSVHHMVDVQLMDY